MTTTPNDPIAAHMALVRECINLHRERITSDNVQQADGAWMAVEASARALSTAGRQVPSGWKLVPVEPTLKQMAAMGPTIRACYEMDGVRGDVTGVYAAMLAATPPAPAQAEPVAWMHHDDPRRVISAMQKSDAVNGGGASASSVASYDIPLVHQHEATPPAQAERKPLFGDLIATHEGLAEELAQAEPTAQSEQMSDEDLADCGLLSEIDDHPEQHLDMVAAPPAPQPLTDEQIVNHGLMMCPNQTLLNSADAFEAGVRFAERHHGIRSKP